MCRTRRISRLQIQTAFVTDGGAVGRSPPEGSLMGTTIAARLGLVIWLATMQGARYLPADLAHGRRIVDKGVMHFWLAILVRRYPAVILVRFEISVANVHLYIDRG